MNVLVAFASRHGATQGIAEQIATTLESDGFDVTLRSVDAAGPLDPYDAVVVGSAAYLGGWLSEATTFVRRNRKGLASRPVWLFSSGPTSGDTVDDKGRDLLKTSEPKEFTEFSAMLRPRGMQVFYGAYDPDAAPANGTERLMNGFMRLVPAIRRALPTGDYRDWKAIEAWAHGIGRELAASGASSA
jgi:menaquinone-dependent protoporphyrinogen oxidase